MKNLIYGFVLLQFLLISCSPKSAYQIHQFPDPVDTRDRPVEMQVKKTYQIDGVYADNQFEGARLNDFEKTDEGIYRATVSPENIPINESAYYAFKLWSDDQQSIELEIKYTHHPHRYAPKISYDRKNWLKLDTMDFDTLKGADLATLRLEIGPDPIYVAGQELYTSSDVKSWCEEISKRKDASHTVIGKSKLGRDLHFVDIGIGPPMTKPAIAIIARQHPPEVSGHMAMNAFIEELLADKVLSNQFRKKFRTLVYPLMNPDGVDLGHWRHSAGGVDMNRDWGEYRQTEVAQVTRHMVKTSQSNQNQVLVGLDFHSTQEDIFYTLTPDLKSSIFPFKDYWYEAIDEAFEEPIGDDGAYGLNNPISKGWFYLQFQAEGITYEVGDETPRDFIKAKAEVAAREMMKLLILRD